MENIENTKYKEIFNNFKKNNAPLPIINLKINQQNKVIEKILKEMDSNYQLIKPIPKKKKQHSENKTRNKKTILTSNKPKDKIDFGHATYLTYKMNVEDDVNLRRYNFELLKQRVLNSNNFRMGYLSKNNRNKNSPNNSNINVSDRIKNMIKNKINMNPHSQSNDKKKKKIEIKINNNNINSIDKNEIKNDYINDNYNFLETEFTTNRNFKSNTKEIRHISPFIENIKTEDNSNLLLDNNNTNYNNHNSYLSYKNNFINNRTNLTNYTTRNYTNYNTNNNKYNITNYLEKKKPIDLKEAIKINNTSSNFKDYKDLFTYYRTNNNFLNNSNNNSQINRLSMLNEEIFDIDDITQLNERKLNFISKKKTNLKYIEKLIRKNVFSNSIIELLTNGKRHKIKLRANFNKMKNQMKHLSVVDKIKKYSDNIPSEKMKTFNHEYFKKSEKIGITNKAITFRNGKIYQQSKSDSKKLSKIIKQNCDEINKLTEQILIDKYYFDEKDSKCKKLNEKIKEEKIDLSINNNL